jgi:NAD(P)H-dependent FMN reductase
MESAQQHLQQLSVESEAFKTLNAMLNGTGDFRETQDVVVVQVNNTKTVKDLEMLALEYEEMFIKPFISNGGRSSSNSSNNSQKQLAPAQGISINRCYFLTLTTIVRRGE